MNAPIDTELGFDAFDDAVARFAGAPLGIARTTPAFATLVPTAAAGLGAERLAEHEPALAALLRAPTDGRRATRHVTLASGRAVRATAVRSDAAAPEHGFWLRLHAMDAVDEGLRDYLRARDALFSTSRRLSVSEMATTLAHEINQPVGAIGNLLGAVRIRLAGPDPDLGAVGEALDRALEQTRHTARVIARIRDFASGSRPRRERCDALGELRAAAGLLDWLLAAQGCRLRWRGVPTAPVDGDATMLRQVFANLLRNAVDAMREAAPAAREILLDCSLGADTVRIEIADRGHGPGDPAALFVPFVSSRPDGMGVGLNICRSFVERHQGRLWLSPREGGGCSAVVELPLATGAPASAGAERAR